MLSSPWSDASSVLPRPTSLLISYARVMGEMAILTMSFLTFPVAHNSVWESVFGVPFDRSQILSDFHYSAYHLYDHYLSAACYCKRSYAISNMHFDYTKRFRAIKYHRMMGVLFWIFATFHMLLFQIKWIQKGVLVQNAWSQVPWLRMPRFYGLLTLTITFSLSFLFILLLLLLTALTFLYECPLSSSLCPISQSLLLTLRGPSFFTSPYYSYNFL